MTINNELKISLIAFEVSSGGQSPVWRSN